MSRFMYEGIEVPPMLFEQGYDATAGLALTEMDENSNCNNHPGVPFMREPSKSGSPAPPPAARGKKRFSLFSWIGRIPLERKPHLAKRDLAMLASSFCLILVAVGGFFVVGPLDSVGRATFALGSMFLVGLISSFGFLKNTWRGGIDVGQIADLPHVTVGAPGED